MSSTPDGTWLRLLRDVDWPVLALPVQDTAGGACNGCRRLVQRVYAWATDERGEPTYRLCKSCFQTRWQRAYGPFA